MLVCSQFTASIHCSSHYLHLSVVLFSISKRDISHTSVVVLFPVFSYVELNHPAHRTPFLLPAICPANVLMLHGRPHTYHLIRNSSLHHSLFNKVKHIQAFLHMSRRSFEAIIHASQTSLAVPYSKHLWRRGKMHSKNGPFQIQHSVSLRIHVCNPWDGTTRMDGHKSQPGVTCGVLARVVTHEGSQGAAHRKD